MPGLPGKTGTKRIEKSLYDLEADIGEKTNLLDRHPDVVAAIDRLAEAMREELGDSLTKRTGRAIRPADRLPPAGP